MNITRRRGAIATFITLGVLTVGLAVTLNITWIILNERTVALQGNARLRMEPGKLRMPK